jgi:hypothetical protein
VWETGVCRIARVGDRLERRGFLSYGNLPRQLGVIGMLRQRRIGGWFLKEAK